MATVRKRPCSLKLFQFRLFLLSTCFLISFLSPDHFTSLPFYIFISFAYLVEYLLNARTQPPSFTSSINLFPLYRFPEKIKKEWKPQPISKNLSKRLFIYFSPFFIIIIFSLQESPEEIVHFELKQKNLAIRIRHFFFLFRFIIPKEPARKRATHR